RGFGTALMECAIEWARAQGLEKLTVSTFSTNLRAINLFKKMGFAITGRRYKQYKLGEEHVDEVLMERFL
ncbi:MAG TPA: GNAT family N-acetyltransferase, partial [Desulfobacterales bacterium]|nr:GNAT family N-acetyltransferase [Desulfobacterales bacterium]